MQADEDGLAYRFTIEPSDPARGIPEITALDLASKMVAMGTYEMPDYRTAFAKVIDTIEIEDDRNVLIKLRRQFVQPEALVQFRYDNPFDGQPPVQNGKYVMTSKNDQIAVLVETHPIPPWPTNNIQRLLSGCSRILQTQLMRSLEVRWI